MKKTLLNSVIVAAGLLAGTMGAWADDTAAQSKKNLFSADFETGQASDYWKLGNGTLLTPTYTGSTGQCATIQQSKDRGDYFLTTADFSGIDKYSIEFDFLLAKGSKTADFAIMSESAWSTWVSNYGYRWKDASTQDHNPFLLYFTIPGNGTTATFNETTDETFTFTEKTWYHFKVDVDPTTRVVGYSATAYGESDAAFTGTYTVPEGESTNCKGFYERNNRYNYSPGAICIDNVSIYSMVSGAVANNPVITLSGVNGAERSYTITFAEGETLYYQLPGDAEYAKVAEGTSVTVKTNTSGTLSAYTENGSAKSDTVTAEVDATPITLNAPTYALSNLSDGYSKEFTVSVDNSNLLLTPTATLSYVFTPKDGGAEDTVALANGGKISATEAGTYVVTAEANGYTSSTLTIDNNVSYVLVSEYNFSGMTADDFSDTDMWEEGTETDSRWGWSDSSPATKFTLKDPAANAEKAFDGLTLFSSQAPIVYIGYGLMAPYSIGNYGNIKISLPNEGLTAVYTSLSNYGKTTNVTVADAADGYALYRYSDMLQSIKLYTPSDNVCELSMPSSGYATFVPSINITVPYVINAYTVTLNNDNSTITLNEISTGSVIAAGTGVLMAGEPWIYAFIGTTAETSDLGDNDLKVVGANAVADGSQYDLGEVGGKIGFCKVESGTVMTEGKAYLQVDNADAAKISFFSLDGEATGISSVDTAQTTDTAFYTLQGVRVAKPSKGLYIMGGKKVVVK